LRVSQYLDHATFPIPATSNAACGFPALRSPVCFTDRRVTLLRCIIFFGRESGVGQELPFVGPQ
jgi:hypothetical protein